MTATAIPIRAPDGSRTATRPWCPERDGVLLREAGPGLGAVCEGRGDGPAGCEGRAAGLAGCEGRAAGLAE